MCREAWYWFNTISTELRPVLQRFGYARTYHNHYNKNRGWTQGATSQLALTPRLIFR